MKRRILKPADAALWLILLAATVIAVAGFNGGNAGRYVTVISPAGTRTVGLAEDQTFTVDGKDGAVTIEVKNGTAAIMESPCQRKLCVQQGYISRVGQSVVCLPEGIKLEISDSAETYDATIH
jgi:hypothetical protein